jgi:hypothetical protein
VPVQLSSHIQRGSSHAGHGDLHPRYLALLSLQTRFVNVFKPKDLARVLHVWTTFSVWFGNILLSGQLAAYLARDCWIHNASSKPRLLLAASWVAKGEASKHHLLLCLIGAAPASLRSRHSICFRCLLFVFFLVSYPAQINCRPSLANKRCMTSCYMQVRVRSRWSPIRVQR